MADAEHVSASISAASELVPLRAPVNCAEIGLAMRTVARHGAPHDLGAFERILRVNLIGSFNCIRLAGAAMSTLEPMASGERGAIVNTACFAAV